VVLPLGQAIGCGGVIVQIVRLAAEEAAEFFQVREVQAAHTARDQVLCGLWSEAVLDHEGVGALDAFERGYAGNVERDHGVWAVGWQNADQAVVRGSHLKGSKGEVSSG